MSTSKWKPYQNYIRSDVDAIPLYPSHWKLKRVKYLINENDGIKIGPFGSSLKLNTLTSDGIKIYGQGNVIKNDFTLGHRHLPIERFNSDFSKYEILDGDVLITMMGTTGKSKVFRKEFKRGIIDSHLIRLRFQKNQFNSDLFVTTLQESEYMSHQLRLKSNGSIMEGLNSFIIKDLYVVKPPLSEQKQIEIFLNRVNGDFSRIFGTLETQLSTIKEKRSTLITKAVTKGLSTDVQMKDSGIDWIGDVPEHWKIMKLSKFARVYSGKETKSEFGKIPIYGANGIIGMCDSSRSKKPTVLVGRVGSSGEVNLTHGEHGVSDNALVIENDESIDTNFLFYIMQSDYFTLDISNTAQPLLTSSKLTEHKYQIPPLQEQLEIAAYIHRNLQIMRTIETNIQSIIEKLKELRTALISAVVTGKIDVSNYQME
jgi:type I restriction enzyme S subunit